MVEVISGLLLQEDENPVQLQALLDHLPAFDQKTVILCCLKFLAQRHLSVELPESDSEWSKADNDKIAAAAYLMDTLLVDQDSRKAYISTWLTSASGAGAGEPVGIRRAALAVLSKDRNAMECVLEKSMRQFGDQLYIKHTPGLQQEGK